MLATVRTMRQKGPSVSWKYYRRQFSRCGWFVWRGVYNDRKVRVVNAVLNLRSCNKLLHRCLSENDIHVTWRAVGQNFSQKSSLNQEVYDLLMGKKIIMFIFHFRLSTADHHLALVHWSCIWISTSTKDILSLKIRKCVLYWFAGIAVFVLQNSAQTLFELFICLSCIANPDN